MRTLVSLLATLVLIAFAQPQVAQAQTCSFTVSTIAFGSVATTAGSAPVDSSGTLGVSCSRLGLLGVTLPVTITVCANLDAGSGGSSGSSRLLTGPSGLTLPYQLYQDASRTKTWGSAAFLQFGAAPTLTFTSNTQGSINTTVPIFARLTPQASASAGTYSSTFSGENFFWGLNIATCAGATVGASAPPPAFNVTANVPVGCALSVSPLDFGTKGLLTTATTASTTLGVTCTAGAPFTVALGNGVSGTGPTQRRMTNGSQVITYGLYQDAAFATPWGSAAGALLSGTGSGSARTLSVYGKVPAQNTPAPGRYADTVVVTLTY